jgi:hypothetical protein
VHSPELRKLLFLRALGGEWGTGRSVGSSAVPATSGRCAGAGSDARRGLAKRWTISCGTCLLSWSLAVPNVISGGVGRIQAVPVLIMYDKRMFLSSAGLPVCRLPVWQDLHAGSDEHACPGFASSAATPAACGLGSRLSESRSRRLAIAAAPRPQRGAPVDKRNTHAFRVILRTMAMGPRAVGRSDLLAATDVRAQLALTDDLRVS